MALFRKARYSTLNPTDKREDQPSKKKEIPHGLWEKCPQCSETIYAKQKEENLNLCPRCSYHYPMTAWNRIKLLTDEGSFLEFDADMESVDKLQFEGVAPYLSKLEENKKKTGLKDAVVYGTASLDERKYVLAVMDFRFLGASMGCVVGEKVTRAAELALKEKLPFVIATASGGARMYEGMLSLMQMAKTSGALERLDEAGLPYIVIMTHPTTAGVTASFASLGDLILAEPGAMIAFAGPRVIKDTTQAKLPEGFQTAEFLLKKGLIDKIIGRKNLRNELSLCLEYVTSSCKVHSAERGKAQAK
ncbi:MAG: acetyl-CoA carboxylase subunit beta [Lentisphaerae bacterium GWF2_45_14]|nr:MAG: acetyl-CoA carboxylase subunit beta [Lentisphaerae bacterium GWF2_45_14]